MKIILNVAKEKIIFSWVEKIKITLTNGKKSNQMFLKRKSQRVTSWIKNWDAIQNTMVIKKYLDLIWSDSEDENSTLLPSAPNNQFCTHVFFETNVLQCTMIYHLFCITITKNLSLKRKKEKSNKNRNDNKVQFIFIHLRLDHETWKFVK